MNDATYQLLKSGRIDKLDLLFLMEPDRFQQTKMSFEGTYATVSDETGLPIAMHVQCKGADRDSGKRIYIIETWGPFAQAVFERLPEQYYKHVCRLDYRIELEVNADRLADLAHYMEKNGRGSRNVNYFNTRERQKSEGRHAGGKGVSHGSHKSDIRLAVYKRKGEPGAIEIQVSGDTVRDLVRAATTPEGDVYGEVPRERVTGYLIATLAKRVRVAGFEDTAQLAAFVQVGQGAVEGSDPVEFAEWSVMTSFDALPLERKQALLSRLSDRMKAAAL
jgi:hypothetical protein